MFALDMTQYLDRSQIGFEFGDAATQVVQVSTDQLRPPVAGCHFYGTGDYPPIGALASGFGDGFLGEAFL